MDLVQRIACLIASREFVLFDTPPARALNQMPDIKVEPVIRTSDFMDNCIRVVGAIMVTGVIFFVHIFNTKAGSSDLIQVNLLSYFPYREKTSSVFQTAGCAEFPFRSRRPVTAHCHGHSILFQIDQMNGLLKSRKLFQRNYLRPSIR